MSLKIRIPARLKGLFPGVALSKKTIEVLTEKLASGLTDESTDDEIDTVLNTRNDIYSFDDQRKYDDYLAGKAAKEASDKEAKRIADIAAGKKPDDVELPSDTPDWAKSFMKAQAEKSEALEAKLAAITGEKVTTSRRELYAKVLEGRDPVFVASELKKFDKMAFADDADFSNTLADFTQDITNSGLGGDRVQSGLSNMPNGKIKPATKDELDSVVSNLKI